MWTCSAASPIAGFSDSNANIYPHCHAHSDQHIYADRYTYSNQNANAYTHINADLYVYANEDIDTYPRPQQDGNSERNPGRW